MQLYAHNWMFKIKVIIGNLQGKSESRKVRESERSSNISTLQHSNLSTTVGESPEVLLSGKRFEKKEREVFKDLPLLVVLSYHTKNTNEQKYLFYRTADIRSVIAIYSPRYDPSYNRRS